MDSDARGRLPLPQLQRQQPAADFRPASRRHPGGRLPGLATARSPGSQGREGLAILAPCVYRQKVDDEHDGEQRELRSLRGFRVAHVFDIAQTEGEPIEELDTVRPQLLEGEAPPATWDALVEVAGDAGFEVIRDRKHTENGYCDFGNKVIAVRPDVTPAQALKTLVHELAHGLLHGDGVARARELQEVEVESVAYVVCGALGLDTGDYSFAYVAGWSGGVAEQIKDTAERVIDCARHILDRLQFEGPAEPDTLATRL